MDTANMYSAEIIETYMRILVQQSGIWIIFELVLTCYLIFYR